MRQTNEADMRQTFIRPRGARPRAARSRHKRALVLLTGAVQSSYPTQSAKSRISRFAAVEFAGMR